MKKVMAGEGLEEWRRLLQRSIAEEEEDPENDSNASKEEKEEVVEVEEVEEEEVVIDVEEEVEASKLGCDPNHQYYWKRRRKERKHHLGKSTGDRSILTAESTWRLEGGNICDED